MPDYLPHVGEILLFKLSPTTTRPLLVTHVELRLLLDKEEPMVWGHLFIRHDLDATSPWINANTFYRPTREQPYVELRGVLPGTNVGNWTPLPPPPPPSSTSSPTTPSPVEAEAQNDPTS